MEITQPAESAQPAARVDWEGVASQVLLSRELDELEETELAPSGEIPYQFSAKGHELAQVLLAQQLNHPHDGATVYYRSRPFMLTVGLTVVEALAAGMGRSGSPSEGRDVGVVFSMPARKGPTVLPASGDVGAQFTPAAGWAQAINYWLREMREEEWQGAIAVALGGDGSVATNGFWSALTIATTLRLPMLFFIEDNAYGLSVPSHLQTPGGDIAANLASFVSLSVFSGSGTSPEEAADLIEQAVTTVRRGDGPALLRLRVPRLGGHTFVDNQAYKPAEVVESEITADPILALEGILGMERVASLRRKAAQEVAEALDAARLLAEPSLEPERHSFANGEPSQVGGLPEQAWIKLEPQNPRLTGGPRVNLIDAVREVLRGELERQPRMVVFGEDVGVKGGVHGATRGLQAEFGEARVFDTSLSEEGIIGRAVGMALAGLLPVPEIQFRKYADPALEQIHDLGTVRWRTAGKFAAPVVVRVPVGFSKKIGDPWHSVNDEAAYAHSTGWRLAFPSNARDAAGLLRAALRGQDPTLFFEHRALLDGPEARTPDPGPDFVLPFGVAARLTEGDELTLVSWGAMIHRCLAAIESFPGRVQLLDLRTIVPWDHAAVMKSVRETGRCLVVHEDTATAGFGSEILAHVADECFLYLDAPLRRLTTPDSPIPYNKQLMENTLPSIERITEAVADLLAF